MRRAKIVATVGPSTNTVEKLEALIKAGANVCRINMSHGTHESHSQMIKNIRQASLNVQKEVAILCDLQGPKIRVDKLPENLVLEKDSEWVIGATSVKDKYPEYKDCFIPTVYENLVSDAKEDAIILFDDGNIEAHAISKKGDVLKIKIVVGGVLKSNKGINLPNVNVTAPSFTKKDQEDLVFGVEHGCDYVALSFVKDKVCVEIVKNFMRTHAKSIPIVAKIERPHAVDNIDELIEVADCIMIARGDMGVELGNHLVPGVQKVITDKCNHRGVPVITATQMLESMINNPRPTRAEATDVANAIWDGTDAVMLSGETASGEYPIKTVEMMDKIIQEAEKTPKSRPYLRHTKLDTLSCSIQVAASIIAEKSDARWIISITQSGESCLRMSRFRPQNYVLGVTNSLEVVRKMSLYWGIIPFFYEAADGDLATLKEPMIEKLRKRHRLEKGDKVVITHGHGALFKAGSANNIHVEIIE